MFYIVNLYTINFWNAVDKWCIIFKCYCFIYFCIIWISNNNISFYNNISSLENKTVLCPNFWKLEFFWKIGLDNSKILLKKLYFLTVKNKLSTGHVVKMLCLKLYVAELDFLRKIVLPQKLGKWTKNGPKTGFFEFIEKFQSLMFTEFVL